jgi:hypothetical protein
MPESPDLPLLDCGLFCPGQPAWFQIREFVEGAPETASFDGVLRIREGIPVLDPNAEGVVWGSLIRFREGMAGQAYGRIASMEPQRQFRWLTAGLCNVLAGKHPAKGSDPLDEQEWDSWQDPCFAEALDVVEEMTNRPESPWDFKEFFRLQMAYLLLWSSIERLASFRHGFGENVVRKIWRLAEEPAFGEALRRNAGEGRSLHRADRPGEKAVLDPGRSDRAIAYYYQVRCNITHRGKSMVSDLEHVRQSLIELLAIFRQFVREAEQDSRLERA